MKTIAALFGYDRSGEFICDVVGYTVFLTVMFTLYGIVA